MQFGRFVEHCSDECHAANGGSWKRSIDAGACYLGPDFYDHRVGNYCPGDFITNHRRTNDGGPEG